MYRIVFAVIIAVCAGCEHKSIWSNENLTPPTAPLALTTEPEEIRAVNDQPMTTAVSYDEFGISSVHRAAQADDTRELQRLLAAGVDVNIRSKKSEWTPLISAIVVKNIAAVRLLIEAGADVNVASDVKTTPLHYSSGEITDLLLVNGADVSARNENGWTPLHSACHFGRTDAVRLLLMHGADFNAKTNDGMTALELAIQADKQEVINLLKKQLAN